MSWGNWLKPENRLSATEPPRDKTASPFSVVSYAAMRTVADKYINRRTHSRPTLKEKQKKEHLKTDRVSAASFLHIRYA